MELVIEVEPKACKAFKKEQVCSGTSQVTTLFNKLGIIAEVLTQYYVTQILIRQHTVGQS